MLGRNDIDIFAFCIDILSCAGDLLQHFLIVIFNKLDKGETWDDDFELNTILQVEFLDFVKLFALVYFTVILFLEFGLGLT